MLIKYVTAALIIAGIVLLYVWSYNLNEKTEKPEDCEDTNCNGCKSPTCKLKK